MLIPTKTIPLAKRNKGAHLGALHDNYLCSSGTLISKVSKSVANLFTGLWTLNWES